MKLIKNEAGISLSETLFVTVGILLVLSIVIVSIKEDSAGYDFNAYFSINPHQTGEKNLVKPLVNKRLEELKKTANDASVAVETILKEPESLDPEGLKEKLERFNESKRNEKSAWSDWKRACNAAMWENYVESCDATK